jgi:hypothetical protein
MDFRSRARNAFLAAEGFERLALNPVERGQALERDFLRGVQDLERRKNSGRLPAPEAAVELEILKARRDESLSRSPEADAYHAYREVYELYAPPETLLTRRSRLKAAAFRQKWRETWAARGLPFSETMFDLLPGEEPGWRWVYSSPDKREISRASDVLSGMGIPARIVSAEHRGPDGHVLLAPEDRFWEAQEALGPLVEK